MSEKIVLATLATLLLACAPALAQYVPNIYDRYQGGYPVDDPGVYVPDGAVGTYRQVKFCTGCKREVPDDSVAGGRCPHCSAFWSYDPDSIYLPSWIPRYVATPGVIVRLLMVSVLGVVVLAIMRSQSVKAAERRRRKRVLAQSQPASRPHAAAPPVEPDPVGLSSISEARRRLMNESSSPYAQRDGRKHVN